MTTTRRGRGRRRPTWVAAAARCLPALAIMVAMVACAHVQIGERNEPPAWRRPGPALLDPQPGIRVPDDGFQDHLARVDPSAVPG